MGLFVGVMILQYQNSCTWHKHVVVESFDNCLKLMQKMYIQQSHSLLLIQLYKKNKKESNDCLLKSKRSPSHYGKGIGWAPKRKCSYIWCNKNPVLLSSEWLKSTYSAWMKMDGKPFERGHLFFIHYWINAVKIKELYQYLFLVGVMNTKHWVSSGMWKCSKHTVYSAFPLLFSWSCSYANSQEIAKIGFNHSKHSCIIGKFILHICWFWFLFCPQKTNFVCVFNLTCCALIKDSRLCKQSNGIIVFGKFTNSTLPIFPKDFNIKLHNPKNLRCISLPFLKIFRKLEQLSVSSLQQRTWAVPKKKNDNTNIHKTP